VKRKALSAIIAIAALALPSRSLAADSACRMWTQSRCDAANGAAIELSAPKSGQPRAWSFDGSGRVWQYQPGMTNWSSPALGVANGRAIVAVGSYDHTLYVLDAASGDLVWKVTTGGPISAAPVFWQADNRSWLFATSNDRLVYALDAADGRQIWVHGVESYRPTLGGARLASPCVGEVAGANDAIFVPYWVWDSSLANSMQRGGVLALSARDGKPIWKRDLGDNELTAAVFARIGEQRRLFLGSSDGNVIGLDADDGRVLWKQTELDAVRGSPAFVDAGAKPLVVMASKYGSVRGLDAKTGAERWRLKTGDRITGSPAVLPTGRPPRVFVGSYDRQLYAIDATSGKLAWSYGARGGIYSSPALVPNGSNPMVLVAAWDNLLHAVDMDTGSALFTVFTGRPLWNVAGLDESNWSSPAAASVNGSWMVYQGSYDGTFRALPLEDADRLTPVLRSNFWFWLSFPISLTPVALFAIYVTRRHRAKARATGRGTQALLLFSAPSRDEPGKGDQ
jgi:outer membrane protein assembly factor BamB